MRATDNSLPIYELGADKDYSFNLAEFAGPYDAYASHVRGFIEFLTMRNRDLSVQAIGEYFRYLNRSNLTASTIRVKRQAVKDRVRRVCSRWPEGYRRLAEIELDALDHDPATKCPGKSSPRIDEFDLVTQDEFERLVDGCRSARQRAFAQFLYTTGARVSELCGVRISDCRESGADVVRIRLRGKGSRRRAFREREVYLPRGLYAAIRETGRVDATSRYLGHSDIRITLAIYSHDRFRPEDVLRRGGHSCRKEASEAGVNGYLPYSSVPTSPEQPYNHTEETG
jgi:integrase